MAAKLNIQTMTITRAMPRIRRLMMAGVAVMLWGDTGIGKTEVVRWIGESMNAYLCDFRTNLHESVDARGIPVPDMAAKRTIWLLPEFLPFVGNETSNGGKFPSDRPIILFCDEVNACSQSMQTVAMQLINERRVGEHELMPNVFILCAGNYTTNGGVAKAMATTLANRMAHLDLIPDHESFRANAIRRQFHAAIVAYIDWQKQNGSNVLHTRESSDGRTFCSPRSWEMLSKVLLACDESAPDFADERLDLATAIIGEAQAVSFDAFCLVKDQIPRLSEIVSNPDSCRIPQNIAACFLLSGMISHNASRTNLSAIIRYAARMGREFEMRTCEDAFTRHPELKESAEYIAFSIANQDITAHA